MNDPKLKQIFKLVALIVLIAIVFIGGIFFGRSSSLISNRNSNTYLTGDFSGKATGINVDVIWEAWNKLEQNYLNKNLDKQKMVYGAIKGIVESLDDPYTQFLTPEDTSAYSQNSGGQFEGIGAMLRFDGEYTVIDSPIDDFPAQKAGLMSNDIILKVDGKDVRGKGSYEVAEMIKGQAGTSVKLSIYRPKDDKELEFNIVRDKIDMDNLKLVEIKDGVGYIKMYRFNESSAQEFINQWNNIIDKLVAEKVDKVIIDLRNNPGGLVTAVQYVSEEFLKKGDLIMSEEERNGYKTDYKATRTGRMSDAKVVILVNQGSASASEIMSGALQDNKRATIIGMPTVGKGVEQTVVKLNDGSTMHIVFRRWLTPSGRQVKKDDSIKPDIEIDLTTEDFQKGIDPQKDAAYKEMGITK